MFELLAVDLGAASPLYELTIGAESRQGSLNELARWANQTGRKEEMREAVLGNVALKYPVYTSVLPRDEW